MFLPWLSHFGHICALVDCNASSARQVNLRILPIMFRASSLHHVWARVHHDNMISFAMLVQLAFCCLDWTSRCLSWPGIATVSMDALPADYTHVSTSEELQQALAGGARDVIVQRHLDLTKGSLSRSQETADTCDSCSKQLFRIQSSTRLVRVRAFSSLSLLVELCFAASSRRMTSRQRSKAVRTRKLARARMSQVYRH
jgi:hypothetical protein